MSEGSCTPQADAQTPLDLIVFGASGFTGRIVAEYLAEHGPPGLRWGLAGRDRAKLEAIRADLAEAHAHAAHLPIIVADALDRASIDPLVRSTKVVCSTVGPYALYGEALVGGCAEAGTHYCDLTGEVPWIRRMIDRYEEPAKRSGARLVHCCGYDSIPSDLGCLMMTDALQDRGAQPVRVRFVAAESKGGVSGGTVASFLQILEEVAQDPSLRRLLGDPYGLCPDGAGNPFAKVPSGVQYDRDLRVWTGPFPMAMINTPIVHRSHALRGRPFGNAFEYSEVMSTGRGALGLTRALLVAGGLYLAPRSFLHRLPTRRLLPKPGEGPSKVQRDRGFFVCRFVAEGQTPEGIDVQLRGVVRGKSDPGYGETAKMLAESALCLALEADQLPVDGGSWTPATAMGARLINRLRSAGMTFEVSESAAGRSDGSAAPSA